MNAITETITELAFHKPAAAITTAPTATWPVADVMALFDLPFNDLMFQAQSAHRAHFPDGDVELATLLSIKTGGCEEDCGYCPQAARYDTGVEAKKILESGAALKKFQEIVKAQGGNSQITSESLILAKNKFEFHSSRSGKIKGINNYNLNTIAKILGSPNDKKAGIYLLKKLDHSVSKNEPIFVLYSDDKYRLREAEATLKNLPIFKIE